jgi:hypothetical protein
MPARAAPRRIGRTARFPVARLRVGIIRIPSRLGDGTQEHPLPPVGGADVGGSYATPDRVIPRFGQPCEYMVEAAVSPSEGGDVLHDDEAWS